MGRGFYLGVIAGGLTLAALAPASARVGTLAETPRTLVAMGIPTPPAPRVSEQRAAVSDGGIRWIARLRESQEERPGESRPVAGPLMCMAAGLVLRVLFALAR